MDQVLKTYTYFRITTLIKHQFGNPETVRRSL